MCRTPSIPHPVINQFHVFAGDDFPAPTTPPPTRGRGGLPAGRRTVDSYFIATAFAGVAQRPERAPSMICGSNNQQPLQLVRAGVISDAEALFVSSQSNIGNDL